MGVCLCVLVCVCACVRVCTYICTHFLYVTFRHLCMCHQPFSPRYEVYICPRPAIFLAIICPHNVSLYRYMCAVKPTEHMVHCDYLVYLVSSYCTIFTVLTLLYI